MITIDYIYLSRHSNYMISANRRASEILDVSTGIYVNRYNLHFH